MARYDSPTGGQNTKYKVTDPIYGTNDRDVVLAGVASGAFVLMEREQVAGTARDRQTYTAQQYIPRDLVDAKTKRGWRVVGAETPKGKQAAQVAKHK